MQSTKGKRAINSYHKILTWERWHKENSFTEGKLCVTVINMYSLVLFQKQQKWQDEQFERVDDL